jgi:7-cyano-7-deazaguanine synthase
VSSALVVLSGGLDSCVALSLARRDNDRIETLSFFYGQRHEHEIAAAEKIAEFYEVGHTVLTIPLGTGESVLMDHAATMPQMTYEELQSAEGPSPTYVPYRNGTFLSLAASGALDMGLDYIYAGMHSEDAHNWAYPDCTPEFIGAMQNAIYIGTYFKVRLVCPFTYKTKAQIIALGAELGAPLHLTYSCYEGRAIACGRCPTCVARLEAFKANNLSDPIDYEFDKYRDGMSKESVKASLQLLKELENE